MHFPGIKAVFFDIDNTLVNHADAESHAIEEVFALYGVRLLQQGLTLDTRAFVRAYRPINEALWTDMAFNRITPDELKRERFIRTLHTVFPAAAASEPMAFATLGTKMGAYYMERYQVHWSLMPSAEQAVAHVAECVPIGIISNGFSDQQRGKLERFGWTNRFSSVVLSSEIGVMKPHKEIFDRALQSLNLEHPSEALYIGDNYASDIEGASEAGWRSVWLNLDGKKRPESKADWTIGGLHELLQFQCLI